MRRNPLQRRSPERATRRPHFRRPFLEFLEARVVPSTIDHGGGFASHGDLTANGSATFPGSNAQLTSGGQNQNGSIFTNARFDITQFSTQFTFVQNRVTNPPGGGLTFTIQNIGPNALGSSADGLGYAGIPNSVAIKFDLFDNAGEGPSSTGIFSGGRTPTVRQAGLPAQFPDISIPLSSSGNGIDLQSQHPLQVALMYDGSTLRETIHDNTTGATFNQVYSVNLPALVGSNLAYVGFTGSTGGFTALQNIATWQGDFGPQTPFGPTISGLSQSSVQEGSAGFTLFVFGSGFVPGATVRWNGTSLATSFDSSTQLHAVVPTSLLTEESTPEHGGPIAVTVFVLASRVGTVSNAATFTVTEAPLSATGGFSINANVGQGFTATVATFTDSGGPESLNDYAASINWGDFTTSTGTISGPSNGVFTVSGSHAYAGASTYAITVTLNHETAAPITVTDTANVGSVSPGSPTISSLSPNTIPEGSGTFTLVVFGSGFVPGAVVRANGAGLTTTFVSSSQLQALLPASFLTEESGPEHGGPFPITVFQTVNGISSTSNAVMFSVSEAPLSATGVGNISANVGQGFTTTVATFTDGGGPESLSDYSASIDWGDATTSPGSISGPASGGVFTVTGSHTYFGGGTFVVTVTLNHETATPVTVTDTVNLGLPGPGFPTISSLSQSSAQEGSGGFTLFVFGSGFVPGATVRWNGISLVTSFDSSTQLHAVVPASLLTEESTAEHGGPIAVTVLETVNGIGFISNAVTFTVTEAPLSATGGFTLSSTVGRAFPATLARFTDAGGPEPLSDYSASINWGDLTTSAGTISGPNNGVFTVSGSHTYAAGGTYTITVTIGHETASPVTVTDTANIGIGPPGGFPTISSLSQSSVQEGSGGFTLFVFGSGFVPGATVRWNGISLVTTFDSGSQLHAVVSASLLREESTAEHGGPISVTVLQSVNGIGSISNAATFTVTEAPLSATGGFNINTGAGQSFTAKLATFTDAGGPESLSDYTASISWGDATSSTGTISLLNGVFTVSGSHTYTAGGTFTISVTIRHETASPVTVTDTASIGGIPNPPGDQPLTATGIDITGTTSVAQDFTVAQFTDPDPNAKTGNFAVPINWGDGTAVTGGRVTQPGGPGTPFFVDATHTYSGPGSFTVHVRIFDEAGASAETFSTATVVSAAAPRAPGSGSAGSGGRGLLFGTNAVQPSVQQALQEGALASSPTAALSAASPVPLSAPTQTGLPGSADDGYWQVLARGDGNAITEPVSRAADDLALVLHGVDS